LAQVLAIGDQDIEGVELDFGVMPASMQSLEIRNPIDAQQHGFAVDDERTRPVLQRGFDDQWITIGPVMAVAGEQTDALVLTLDNQPIAVMLDLVDPIGADRNRRSAGRNGWLVDVFPMSRG